MSDFDQDIQKFWDLLFEIVVEGEKRLATHLSTHGLTPPQFYVLKTLYERDGQCRIGEIAEKHFLTNATMTGIIKRLEAMNPPLVKRVRSADDGRAVDVVWTKDGEQRFLDVQASLMNQIQTFLGLLSADDRQQTIQQMEMYFRAFMHLFPTGETPS